MTTVAAAAHMVPVTHAAAVVTAVLRLQTTTAHRRLPE